MLLQGLVRLVVLIRGLDARCAHWIGACESALTDEALGLSGVRFVLNAIITPRDYPVEGAGLLRIVGPGS